MKSNFKKGQKFGIWTLVSFIAGGGNGEVWKCVDTQGSLQAIKLLKSINQKSYDRFLDETNVLKKNMDIEGIIPIIDKNLPVKISKSDTPFFVMPIGKKVKLP